MATPVIISSFFFPRELMVDIMLLVDSDGAEGGL